MDKLALEFFYNRMLLPCIGLLILKTLIGVGW